MNRPLIGLTMDSGDTRGKCQLNADYVESVVRAGGIPLAMPFAADPGAIPRILDVIQGVLFIGGDDLDPALYGEQWHQKAIRIEPRRQEFELALVSEVERRRIPAMGICLGCQLLNVHRGGSLHQFLPDLPRDPMIEHRKDGRDMPAHPVRVDLQTQLGRAIGKDQIEANTYHKQAVNRLGRGFVVAATAPDGVIEAFEDPAFPLFAGVQWHPERLNDRAEHLAVFRLLVEKAASGI